MARKAVLDGGKRDEIISKAMQLFFINGYEATSVRMILEQVGGEVGMFYHYFQSKEELFQKVVEHFFHEYRVNFEKLTKESASPEQFTEDFLTYYEINMQRFHSLSGNMHWTIQYAMAARTIEELKPAMILLLQQWKYNGTKPVDIAAAQILYALSATLHSESFSLMSGDEKKKMLIELAGQLLT